MKFDNFAELFRKATGNPKPFPYQERFATADVIPELIHAPTGAGKTAAAVLGWLWHYFYAGKSSTPRRLVYCLPMRVLVEQTRDEARQWVENLELEKKVGVHVLMGGEEAEDWDIDPEQPAILIGTQDMLLSRALNRGYGMSRFRWPMHFGLLNNDCLWVLDEIQLMGTGLATSTQLQAFRECFPTVGTTRTVWMSATLLPDWLASIDYRDRIQPELQLREIKLDPDSDYEADGLRERWRAGKPLRQALTNEPATPGQSVAVLADNVKQLATFVKDHHQPGSLTLVIVNTVRRSRELFEAIRKLYQPPSAKPRSKAPVTVEPGSLPDLKLIHSRFRPQEREGWRNWLTQDAGALSREHPAGRIVISTQVVEAGVDLSARTLVTELAPWPSLVQRFGRCNRRGEFLSDNPAQVFWVDVPTPDDRKSAPYLKVELEAARSRLQPLSDVGLKSLTEFFEGLSSAEQQELFPFDPPHVIRRKDFVDLFDTTPDLAGNDIDISRFIREGEEHDVRVFWRAVEPPRTVAESPQRNELCPVSFIEFRDGFLRKGKSAFRWDALEGTWIQMTSADTASVFPGQVYWIPAREGGYSAELGWEPTIKTVAANLLLTPANPASKLKPETGYDDDAFSRYEQGWQTLAEHTQEVCDELSKLLDFLPIDEDDRLALEIAARWHDWGKAHAVFQAAITKRPAGLADSILAKAPQGCWKHYERKHFRHELASALGVLVLLKSGDAPRLWTDLAPPLQNLALYLIAAHHGKVRLSIRSMPDEHLPDQTGALFARGVWQDDQLPGGDLGGGAVAPEITLDLSPMRLGRIDGQPSWAERMLRLRDDPQFGPLKLAYLETLLRAADIRASRAADGQRNPSIGETP